MHKDLKMAGQKQMIIHDKTFSSASPIRNILRDYDIQYLIYSNKVVAGILISLN
jgi:hypothetical protein